MYVSYQGYILCNDAYTYGRGRAAAENRLKINVYGNKAKGGNEKGKLYQNWGKAS